MPAAIACADVGDLADAHRHLTRAEVSAARWDGSAWDAAVLEARAHVARAEGRPEESAALTAWVVDLFQAAGHPLDAVRCGRGVSALVVT